MNQTGGANRPGTAPSGQMKWARGKPKSEEWCGKPAGLHGPLLLGCGQGLAPQGSSANEGRFRQFMPEISKTLNPSALVACQRRPGSAIAVHARLTLTGPAALPGGIVRTRRSDPAPSDHAASVLGTGAAQVRVSEARAATHRSGLSAPGFSETLRDEVIACVHAIDRDGGQRPPIAVGPEPLDHDPAARH